MLLLGACACAALGSCRPRPSTVPLGGVRDQVAAVRAKSAPASLPSAGASTPSVPADEADDAESADEVEVTASAAPATSPSVTGPEAAPVAFQVKPYVAGQSWTRVVDVEVALKVGAGAMDMKMTTHQEARFEVIRIQSGAVERLALEYPVYQTTLAFMGSSQDSPEELAGKRFVITFNQGKPDVRDAAGAQPPKKQVDSVKDDAREPLEIEKALKELATLTPKGRGDFSTPGAIALAGGEDEDTKVTRARGVLQKLLAGSKGERLAVIELGYTLTSELDDSTTLEATVSGSLTVVDAPSRFQTSTMQGPVELRSTDPGGMSGRGTIKVVTSYRY